MSQRFRTVQATIFVPNWSIDLIEKEFVQFYIGQQELCPKTNSLHFHVHLELKKQTRLTTIQNKILHAENCHIEKVIDRKGSIKYCSKLETRIKGPWSFGEQKEPGKRNDLETVKNMLKNGDKLEKINEECTETYIKYSKGIKESKFLFDKQKSKQIRIQDVTLIYGEAGVGKSKEVWELTKGMEDTYKLDTEGSNLWFDGYDGEKTLWIDEFDGSGISLTYFLKMLDIYPLRLPIKGNYTFAQWNKIIITSNKHFRDWYPGITKEQYKAIERRIHNVFLHTKDATSRVSEVAGNTNRHPSETEIREEED